MPILRVGISNTLATGGVIPGAVLPVAAMLAYTVAFSIGILLSVTVTPRIVFRESAVMQRTPYALWYIIVYVLGLGLVYALRPQLAIDTLAVVGITAGCTAVLSYLGARRLFAGARVAGPDDRNSATAHGLVVINP